MLHRTRFTELKNTPHDQRITDTSNVIDERITEAKYVTPGQRGETATFSIRNMLANLSESAPSSRVPGTGCVPPGQLEGNVPGSVFVVPPGRSAASRGEVTMPRSATERASIGGKARAAQLSPERRREIARQGYIAAAVKAVVDRAPELTPEQFNKLRAIFANTPSAREGSGR